MNKSEAVNLVLNAKLVEAFAKGATIQYTPSGDGRTWKDIQSPSFLLPPECYRIKRDLKTVWLVLNDKDVIQGLYEDKSTADKCPWLADGCRLVEFKEQI